MFCPSCHTKNQFFNNYCYHCGHRLKKDEDAEKELQNEQDVIQLESDTMDKTSESTDSPVEDMPMKDESIKDESLDSYTSTYEYLLEEDNLFADKDLFGDDTSSELDLSTQIPLRRYQKDKPSTKKKKVRKVFLSLFFMGVMTLAVFALVREVGQRTPGSANLSHSIAVSSSVEETTKDGEKAYRIIFNTVNGKEISFLGETLKVENGRGELVVKDALLYAYNPQLTDDEMYRVELDATVSAPDTPDAIERVSITLSPPYNYAPFTLLQPATSETDFQGDSTKVSFKVEPDSKVVINEEDFSDLLSDDGRFEKEFKLSPQEDELVLDIRVSTLGFLDNIQQIILRKATMDVPLEIKDPSPISSQEQWIKVTGTIHPEATIESDREIFEEPQIDRETGGFTVYIKAERPGYTPCTLTAKLGGKESSVDIVLDRKTSMDTYTSTAWEPNYDELQRNPELSNGRHFVFSGRIKDIIETGNRNIFTVNLSGESQSEQLFYVEYWGSFDRSPGDRVRIFGNRWGNENNMPRFLAKYIYD